MVTIIRYIIKVSQIIRTYLTVMEHVLAALEKFLQWRVMAPVTKTPPAVPDSSSAHGEKLESDENVKFVIMNFSDYDFRRY